MKFLLPLLSGISLLLPAVFAHGDESPAALRRRADHEIYAARQLSKCSHKLRRRELVESRLAKRDALINHHLKKRGLSGVGVEKALKKRAEAEKEEKPAGEKGSNTCILTPEVMVGPYYVKDMLFRKDIRDGEGKAGVPLLLDIQFVDIDTCEPIPKLMADIWHCNTTGIYSGYEREGTAGETFSRGLQETDEEGIVQMITSVPGWYVGRATHIHIASHIGGSVDPKTSTYNGGNVTHIGQLFFPETFLSKIDQTYPYTLNKLPSTQRVRNNDDFIYLQAGAGNYNQDMGIHRLGDKLEDGVLGVINIGINRKASYDINDMFGGTGFPPNFPEGFSLPPEWITGLPSGVSLPPGFPTGMIPGGPPGGGFPGGGLPGGPKPTTNGEGSTSVKTLAPTSVVVTPTPTPTPRSTKTRKLWPTSWPWWGGH